MQAKHQQVQDLENLFNDRVLPTCLEAEEAILGGILQDPKAIVRVNPLIATHEIFSIDAHQKIFIAARDLHNQGNPTDLLTVTHELLNRKWLDRMGGQAKLAQLVERTVSTINIDKYAELVVSKWLKREAIKALNLALDDAYAPSKSVQEVLDDLAGRLQKVKAHTVREEGMQHSSTIVANALQEILAIEAGTSELTVPTGYYDLDAISGGLPIGALTIAGGRAGMAKSTLALNIAFNVASNGGAVAFFAMEMSKSQVAQKLISISTKVNSEKIFRPKLLNSSEWDMVIEGVNTMSLPLWVNDKSEIKLQQIRDDLRTIQEISPTPIKLVIVDYIGLMCGLDVHEIDETLKGLRCIAKDFNVALLGLAQISRGVEGRDNKRPQRHDFKGSGGYESEAALLLGLFREDYNNPDSPNKGILEVLILKNRFGKEGETVNLLFKPERSKVENLKGRN